MEGKEEGIRDEADEKERGEGKGELGRGSSVLPPASEGGS